MIRRLLVIFTVSLAAGLLPAQVCDTALWVPNGPVKSTFLRDSLLYVGGSFTQVSPLTGHFAVLDSTTAAVTPPFPVVNGTVNCLAKDTAGRIYVGGKFSLVGAVPCQNLFRLDPQGNFDAAFRPDPDGEVFCITIDSPYVWVGGDFHTIANQDRERGALFINDSLQPFDAQADGPIYAMWPSPGRLTVTIGGDFHHSGGGSPIPYLEKLKTATGQYLPTGNSFWSAQPGLDGPVYAIREIGNELYIAGDFVYFGSYQRNGLARLDSYTGLLSPALYDAGINGTVRSMEIANGKIYIGGHFTQVDGQPRVNLASLDLQLNVLPWHPSANGDVYALRFTTDSSMLYIGGNFYKIDTTTAYRAALVDTAAAATVHAWDPRFDGSVYALLPGANGVVYAGGAFNGANGVLRKNLCAINIHTRQPDSWQPQCSNTVETLYADNTYLYAAGDFTMADAQLRNHIASFDLATRSITPFNPGVNGSVRTMTGDGTKLYIGGNFSIAGGQARDNLAAIDVTTGLATVWNPGCAGTVNKLVLDHDHLYVAGFFSQTGGQFRDNLARVSVTTGLADWNWSCNTDDGIYDMELYNGSIYFAGWFQNAGGQSRLRIAAADTLTGAALPFDPGADNYVRTLARWGDDLFFSGNFLTVGTAQLIRPHLCNFDIGDGAYDNWTPWPNLFPETMQASQDWIFLGGSFYTAGFRYHPYLAMISVNYVTGIAPAPAEQLQLNVYPNPASDWLYVPLPENFGKNSVLRMYDAGGKLIREIPCSERMMKIGVATLPAGLYELVAVSENQQAATARFLR